MSCSATRTKGPPLIIFKGKAIWDSWIPVKKSESPETTYAATDNGWMETTVFFNYIEKNFIPITNPSAENPILLIYDSHASHFFLNLIEMAKKNYLTTILLPPPSFQLSFTTIRSFSFQIA